MEKKRLHIYFTGRVQGVGFRYRSIYIAQSYGLTGWVKNLWDGRVEMEAQGPEPNIYNMISALNTAPFIEITDYEVRQIPLLDEEYTFRAK